MTAEFHEGEEVDVYEKLWSSAPYGNWRKAKIVFRHPVPRKAGSYQVQFPNGSRAVFNAEDIRPVDPNFEHAPESKPGGGFL